MSRWASTRTKTIQPCQKLGQQAGLNRLTGLFIVAVLFVFVIAGKTATAEVLFQSPQSPPAEPQPTATPLPPEPTPIPPTPLPPEPAPAEQAIEVAPTAEALPDVEEVPVEQQIVEPTSTPLPPPTEVPTATAELQAEAEVAPEVPEPQPIERSRRREEVVDQSGPRNFILDQAELIDTVAVSGAYIWLCCGFGLLLIAPLFLLLLYIRGRSRIIQDDNF